MKRITLQTVDGFEFAIGSNILTYSNRRGPWFNRQDDFSIGKVGNIPGPVLSKLLEWLDYSYTYSESQNLGKTEWANKFMDVDEGLLVDLLIWALHFDIYRLSRPISRKIATLLREERFPKVTGLSMTVQHAIAEQLLPNALEKLLKTRRIQVRVDYQARNRIWTSIFKDDVWFEAVLNASHPPNPVLIGKNLDEDRVKYLVFSSMDHNGKIWNKDYNLNLEDSLRRHYMDEKTHECTIKRSGIVVNFGEARTDKTHAVVPKMEEQLVHGAGNGKRWTFALHLNNCRLAKLENVGVNPDGTLRAILSSCGGPNTPSGSFLCVDTRITVPQHGYIGTQFKECWF